MNIIMAIFILNIFAVFSEKKNNCSVIFVPFIYMGLNNVYWP